MEGEQDGIFEIPDSVYKSEGWGPPKACKEPYFIPFAPFSRSDRLGKIADWISPHGEGGGTGEFYRRGDDRRKRPTFPAQQYFGSEADSTFSFAGNQGDYNSFSLVDRTTTQKKSNFRQGRHMRGGLFGGRGGHNIIGRHNLNGYFNYHQQGRKDDRRQGGHKKGNPWFDKSNRAKDFFIEASPNWVHVREFEFDAISKMYFAQAKFVGDM